MASNIAAQALLKPTSEHGRNLFPLDNRHVYSQKAGHITPVKAIHFEPGSHFDITAHDFTLTFPMQTAPFLRGRKEFAFYSVYYNAVWSLFNQYQTTRQDPKTSAFGRTPTLQEPRIRLADLYYACLFQFFDYLVYEDVIPAWINNLALNDSIIAANKERAIGEARDAYLGSEHQVFTAGFSFKFSLNPSDTYNFSWSLVNSYNGDFVPSNTALDQLDVRNYSLDIVGHFRVYNWVRKLDMLGYGNLYPYFRGIENTILTLLQNNTYDTAMSQINTLLTERMSYLVSLASTTVNGEMVYKMVNLYPICAYNAIFYHFFRNSYYDLSYYPHDYNLDFVSVDTTHGNYNQVGMSDFSTRFLDIEYHQWKKDTFTAVLPDTQFGAVSSITMTSNFLFDKFYADVPESGAVQAGVTGSDQHLYLFNYVPSGSTAYDNRISYGGDVNSSFDVIALKRAEMLQEYRQQLMRAGNKTSDIFRALYGKAASSEHEDDIIPRFLDTFGEDIFVDPVQSTANTGSENPNGQLGDIAARGKFRGDSQMIKFNAGGNFGLILVLSYIVPTAEYNSYMLDKHVLELTPEDHFIPQFENLGLEPIFTDELNMLVPASDIHVLGYAPRYHHKKSELDLIHGAFCSWKPNFDSADKTFGFFGDFNNWVCPRTDLQSRNTTSKRDFYINPSCLDNIFVRAAGADQADDQFICNTFFEINAIKEMSKIGLINFV